MSPRPTQKSIPFPQGKTIVSRTNIHGTITDVNDTFIEISGYHRDELIGTAHNILRHPDMPKSVFANLWDTITQGKTWRGVVKNLAKNGDHYWVVAEVTPIKEQGTIVGYLSVRTPPTHQQINIAEQYYQALNDTNYQPPKNQSSLWRRIKIQPRLSLFAATLAVMAVVVGSVGIIGQAQTHHDYETLLHSNITLASMLRQSTAALGEIRTQLLLALQHDPSSRFSATHDHPVALHFSAIDTQLDNIDRLLTRFKQQAPKQFQTDTDQLINHYQTLRQQGIMPTYHAEQQGQYTQANQIFLTQLNPQFNTFTQAMLPLLTALEAARQQTIHDNHWRYQVTLTLSIILTLIGMAFAIWLGRQLAKGIVTPIQQALSHFEAIGSGDLTTEIPLDGHDELADLLNQLAGMQVQLKAMLDTIRQTSGQLNHYSQSLIQEMAQVQSNTAQQHNSLSHITQLSQQVSSASHNVAHNISHVANEAQNTHQQAQQGSKGLLEGLNASIRVSERVQVTGQQMHELHQAINKITDITSSISEIAEQTNLLALNAAIEAARAGEHGRGFAVVADEVRLLAEKTSQSTSVITQNINNFQKTIESASEDIRRSVEEVTQSVDIMSHSRSNIEAITQASNQVAEHVQHIAATSEEQAVASREVDEHIQKINQIGEHTSTLANEANHLADKLAQQAKQMQSIVSQFRLESAMTS